MGQEAERDELMVRQYRLAGHKDGPVDVRVLGLDAVAGAADPRSELLRHND